MVREIGGRQVMSIQRIPGGLGVLARNCVVDTPVGHVCLTTGDVVVHSGGVPTSIATDYVRNTIFGEMTDNYERAFVTANPAQSEVWVCYPANGSSACTKAAIWNWRSKTWTFRTLRDVIHGAFGQMPAPEGLSWDEETGSWDDATDTWGGSATLRTIRSLPWPMFSPPSRWLDTG
jgi:hypothetical protein